MSNSNSTTNPGAPGASKNVPRIVPWLNADDWRQTRKFLYSSDVEEIRLGLLQAKIWMDRGKVPTAVESTVNFVETILMDREYLSEFLCSRLKSDKEMSETEVLVSETEVTVAETDSDSERVVYEAINDTGSLVSVKDSMLMGSSDERVLRLAYNAAIIRFVNELVDRAQKSLFATSITKLAEQIGLPRVFVDIRHDGTHDKLNSLELLRWAALEALKWLEDQYWSYEDEMTPASWLKEFNENVHYLLNQYCDQLEKINEIQSAVSLEKSSNSRIINQIDFLQTLPRIMKCFLFALCDFDRKGSENVVESIVKILTRNNWDIFVLVIPEVLIERKEKDGEKWVKWIVEEIKKHKNYSKADNLATKLLENFAKKSSEELFKDRLLKVWEALAPVLIDEKVKQIYSIFDSVYMKKKGKQGETNFKLEEQQECQNILKKRKYFEDENLESWSIVNENWRQCPLGTIPK
jgi:hypothetical protein